jgi:hypothetical protein
MYIEKFDEDEGCGTTIFGKIGNTEGCKRGRRI